LFLFGQFFPPLFEIISILNVPCRKRNIACEEYFVKWFLEDFKSGCKLLSNQEGEKVGRRPPYGAVGETSNLNPSPIVPLLYVVFPLKIRGFMPCG